MHHTSSLISFFSQPFQLPINGFKQRQNAPFCVLAFKFFSAVPTSLQIKSIHLPHPAERSPWKVLRNENIATQFYREGKDREGKDRGTIQKQIEYDPVREVLMVN